MAGAVGCSLDDVTIRELMWRFRGLQKVQWAVASAVLAKLHNCHVSKKRDARTPDDFNPFSIEAADKAWKPTKASEVKDLAKIIAG